jgi:hypothetical protein
MPCIRWLGMVALIITESSLNSDFSFPFSFRKSVSVELADQRMASGNVGEALPQGDSSSVSQCWFPQIDKVCWLRFTKESA